MATIIPGSGKLELKNIPTSLILFATYSRETCGQYVTAPASCKRCKKEKKEQKKDYAHLHVAHTSNNFLKAISVWLILKNMNTSGNIQNYRSYMKELAAFCKVSVRTLDARLAFLRANGLCYVKDKSLYMLSVQKVLRMYDLNDKEFQQPFTYDTDNNITLEEILSTIEIKVSKENWSKAYHKKISRNQDAFNYLRNLLIAYVGADESRLHQPGYFRKMHLQLLLLSYKEDELGREEYNFLHKTLDANPDCNARQDTSAFRTGYNSTMGFVHLKRRLMKKQLITVTKHNVSSDYKNQHRKDEEIFHHRYNQKARETVWFRPDQIAINTAVLFGAKQVA